jgi:hypothetical protein
MSEFAKLRTGTGLAGRLLRAGMRDAPNGAARRAAEKALGLSLVTTAAAAAPFVPAQAVTTTLTKLSAGVLARWLGLGLLAGAVTGGSAHVVSRLMRETPRSADVGATLTTLGGSEVDARPKRSADTSAGRERAAASAVSPAAFEHAGAERVAHKTTAERGAPRAAAERVQATPEWSSSSASSVARDDTALDREIALLERVRAKVRSGDARGALAELDRVAAEVRLLANEAQLLRVEALLENGERARAEELAAEIERKNPGGSQGFRLRRLLRRP